MMRSILQVSVSVSWFLMYKATDLSGETKSCAPRRNVLTKKMEGGTENPKT